MHFVLSLGVALYAIVGGPSVGKTAIIEELEALNEIIVQESATEYIQKMQKEGVKEPWNDEAFDLILLQLYLEKVETAKNQARSKNRERIFTDRGVLDHFVYSELLERTTLPSYIEIEKLVNSLDVTTYYEAVFYIHPHNGTEFQTVQTDVRREDTDEAKTIMTSLYHIYKTTLPRVIEVPPHMTPKERAAFILNRVGQLQRLRELP